MQWTTSQPNITAKRRLGCRTLRGCCLSICALHSGTFSSSAETPSTNPQSGRKATGRNQKLRLLQKPGIAASRNFCEICRQCRSWSLIRRPTCSRRLPGGRTRLFFGKPCCWRITTPTTSRKWSMYGGRWGHGRKNRELSKRFASAASRDALFRSFAEKDFYSASPSLVDSDQFPVDLRLQVMKEAVGSGMNVEGGRDQQ